MADAEEREVWSVPVSTVFPLVLSYYKQGKSGKTIKHWVSSKKLCHEKLCLNLRKRQHKLET